jgi:hypothetical protein
MESMSRNSLGTCKEQWTMKRILNSLLKGKTKKHLECMLGPLGWLHETSYSKRICHNFWLGQCPLLRTEYLGIHVHDIFTSIQIKFDIDKNNNQQLKTIWERI